MKALLKCIETLRRDRAMSKDTGELIKKSINVCCQRSLVIVTNAPFSQSLSHIYVLEKWFPLQGERGHSSYFRCFQKQNREEGETE